MTQETPAHRHAWEVQRLANSYLRTCARCGSRETKALGLNPNEDRYWQPAAESRSAGSAAGA